MNRQADTASDGKTLDPSEDFKPKKKKKKQNKTKNSK
jgi:hypothetical protein